MKHVLIGLGICLFILAGGVSQAKDAPGCKDHPLFTRIQDFEIDDCTSQDFDRHEFYTAKEQEITFEGHKTWIGYCLKEGGRERSFLEIFKNYGNAITKIGGTVELQERYNAYFHLAKDGKEAWVHIADSGGNCYSLNIVEKKAMVQEITANTMLEALNKQGFIALYINFDVNKATIKPDSQGIVNQIVQMLKSNPSLKVCVEGHTDNTGTPAANKKLSQDRAASVMDALVKQSIDAKRLAAVGWGQDKPVADNRTEGGKAKNRRVEIVKK